MYGRAYASFTHFDHDQHFQAYALSIKSLTYDLLNFRPIPKRINTIVPFDLQTISSQTFHLNTFKFLPEKVVQINLKDILKSIPFSNYLNVTINSNKIYQRNNERCISFWNKSEKNWIFSAFFIYLSETVSICWKNVIG